MRKLKGSLGCMKSEITPPIPFNAISCFVTVNEEGKKNMFRSLNY